MPRFAPVATRGDPGVRAGFPALRLVTFVVFALSVGIPVDAAPVQERTGVAVWTADEAYRGGMRQASS